MASVSAQFSVTVRVELDARSEPLGKLTASIAEAGGALQGVDLVPGAGAEGKRVREFTIDARDQSHWEEILRAIGSTRGARVIDYVDRTLAMHRGGKIEQHNKYPLKTRDDLSMAYTPGVARVCMEIHEDRKKAFDFTIKKNTVAVVSDGSAVLGLGDIGPEAAMPVMEGKAMLFKEFAGIDAFPICLDTNDPEKIIEAVRLIAPTFGGINLEDISAPRCFEIEEALKDELDIPVFHDDQHGTAVVTMAALFNALKIVGKPIEDLNVLMLGLGAAGVAVTKMMLASGVTRIIGCDRKGALATSRDDYEQMTEIKRWYSENSNPEQRLGSPAEVIEGADLFVGLSGPGLVEASDLERMNDERDRLRDGQPDPRGDAGGRRALRPDHGHRPIRLPEPDQQRARVPGRVQGRARRRRAADHRGDEAGGGPRDRRRRRRGGPRRGLHHPLGLRPRRRPGRGEGRDRGGAQGRDRARLGGDRHLLDDRVADLAVGRRGV